MSNEDADKVMGIGVAKIFLERAQNRATFRIRAISLRGATVNLQIAANRLGELRKMIDDFHDWQLRGWNPEGAETPSKVSTLNTEEWIQPEVLEMLRRQQRGE